MEDLAVPMLAPIVDGRETFWASDFDGGAIEVFGATLSLLLLVVPTLLEVDVVDVGRAIEGAVEVREDACTVADFGGDYCQLAQALRV